MLERKRIQEPEAEYGCDFIGVVRDILPDIIFQQNPVKHCVMVNCMHQLDCGIGCLDVWSHILLGILVRVFWMRLTFEWVN